MLLRDISKELLTAFEAKKGTGPVDRLNYEIFKNIGDAFDGKRKNCWTSSIAPFEFIPLFDDMMNLPIELVISNLARFGRNSRLIDLGSEALECREICTCMRGVTGGIATDQYPKPDILMRSSHFCVGADKMFDLAVEKYGTPYYLVNVPLSDIPNAVDYVARQFEDIFNRIQDYLGIQVTQSKIEEVFGNINKTYANFKEIGQLMRHVPAPATEEVYLSAWMFTFILGSKEAVEISQAMVDKIKDNINNKNFPVPDEKYRIQIQGFAWIPNPIVDWIRAHENVSVIWNGFEYSSPYAFYNIEPLDPKDPFKSLANLMVQNALVLRTPELLAEAQYQFVKENAIDGIITTMPWACMIGGGAYPSHKNFMSRRKVPYIDLGVDCYDEREFNTERARKDIELFLSAIMNKKTAKVAAA